MSWLGGGLGRLLPTLHPGCSSSKEQQQNEPPPATAAAAATSPAAKSKALFGLVAKRARSEEQQGDEQQRNGAEGAAPQQQASDAPGSAYANLSVIQQQKPSRAAAADLAAAVLAALPGTRLDDSWVVYRPQGRKSPRGPRPSSPTEAGHICILPDLQPAGYFCSTAAVAAFLQQLQDAGVPLPGVVGQPAASPTAAKHQAAAVAAALQSCGPGFKFIEAADSVRDSTGSGQDLDMAAAPAATTAAAACEDAVEQQRVPESQGAKRPRGQHQPDRPMQHAPADPHSLADAPKAPHQQPQQRPQKRSRHSPAESSLDRKSSGASTPPVSPHKRARAASPAGGAAAAAGSAAAAAAAAAAAGRHSSPMSADGDASSEEVVQATSPAGTAAGRLSTGRQSSSGATAQVRAGPSRQDATPAELETLSQQQETDARKPGAAAQPGEAAVTPLVNDLAMPDAFTDRLAAAVPPAGTSSGGGDAAAAAGGAGAGGSGAKGGAVAGAVRSVHHLEEWDPVLHRLSSLRSSQPAPPPPPSAAPSSAATAAAAPEAAAAAAPTAAAAAARAAYSPAKLNRVDAKLESVRRAALKIGREPSLSAEMAAPRPGRKYYKASTLSAAAAAGDGGGKAGLPPRPRAAGKPGSSGAGRPSGRPKKAMVPATNTFSAASDVKARRKLDSLLRAKEAAAAMKAAVQSGLPYEGTLEQRHHAMRQQLRHQLADGRVPCAEGLVALQAALSAQLPGARLDSEWLVYPASPQDAVPRLDVLIRHPRVPQGYFRSLKAVVSLYSSLTDLLKASKGSNSYYASRELLVPGLSILPDTLQQQYPNKSGRSPGEMLLLVNKALGMVGRSFVRDELLSAAADSAERRRPSSPGDSADGAQLYPAGGTKAAAANATAVAARRWQPPPLVANLEAPRKGSSVLVLGMFYASEATAMESHSGLAQYRDRIRLAALHKQVGYIPLSYDRDHEVQLAQLAPDEQGRNTRLHVQGNFNSKRGAAAVADRFPDTRFTAVFCDYFRMPSGYAGDIYKAQLFLDYIPELVRRGNLPAGVPIYLPNSPVLLEQLASSGAFADYGDVVAVPARCYPLYEATRHAESAGLMPAKYSNEGQVRELVPGAEFIVVHYCGDATPPMPAPPAPPVPPAAPAAAT